MKNSLKNVPCAACMRFRTEENERYLVTKRKELRLTEKK
ncbi:hypothetical protein BFO_0465 [Tannerella forsythia 92A2]|uniref:Uncharacterized protein n=1 Tax=Tannerella forsythia (strain ATCC 43037 / JCM 10827 / CCUG 21028 A / KCTC 5666 / FDC 338) TaxID=203275 RepID=G8UKX4_TANFA|nr:hypothetical protein BFO_0465 [Tannerella forsythia 92A2]